MMWYLGAAALAAVVTWLTTPWVSSLAHRLGVLDRPDARKQHHAPTPRLGGIAIITAMLAVAWCLFVFVNRFSAELPTAVVPIAALSLGVVAVFLLGLADDLININGKLKLLALLVIAGGVGMGGVRIPVLDLPGLAPISSLWIMTPLSALCLVSVCVAINFIDGIDGLASGIIAIAAASIAVVAGIFGVPFVAILAACLAGACVGFLGHNWPSARIFLGDCGSMTLGFTTAGLTMVLANARSATHPALSDTIYIGVLLALAVPILDTTLTFVRRGLLERRSIFSAERGHVHHRLLDAGLSVPQVLRLLLGLTFICAVAGVMFATRPSLLTLAIAAISLIPMVIVFRAAGSVRLREIVGATRSSIRRSRENEKYNKSFEEMQVRFRRVKSFDEWWDQLCEAGRQLQITAIDLRCPNRDGTIRELNWSSPACESRAHAVELTLPVPQRRLDSPIECRLSVSRNGSLESVGYRMSLFGRLLESHGLGTLPTDSPVRLQKRSTVLRLAGLSERVASLRGTKRKFTSRDSSEPSPSEIDQPVHRSVDIPADLLAPRDARRDRPRVAVIHDFLYIYGGAERVLENILAIYPEADLFSLFDFLNDEQRKFIGDRKVKTSFIQRLPMARRFHRHYLALMPLAVEQLDMSGYDIIISSSYVAAKGVITGPDQLHVCYCHTPARYAWDLQEQCLEEAGLKKGIKSWVARCVLHYIRAWDLRSSHSVDAFVTNSNFVKKRVKKIYGRDATTIYPPVDVENFSLCEEKEQFYLTASRLVPYKKIALIAEAFTQMPDKRLVIIGDGPEFEAIRAKSGPNVILKGFLPHEELVNYMQRAKAFVFTAIEDFGIVPVEAQACGTPVIGLSRGGVCESVIDGETGVLFAEQNSSAIIDAVRRFEMKTDWSPRRIRNHAMRFSAERFRQDFSEFIGSSWDEQFTRDSEQDAVSETESANFALIEQRSNVS